jgi:protein phosphatase
MAELVIHIGCRSAQGVRPNNEDSYLVDSDAHLFVVADGMGGQERGEQASSMAVEIIPKVVRDRLAANDSADQAVQQALAQANAAIIEAGRGQPEGRRMGTTAVLALRHQDQVYVAGLGDSRAYLVRGDKVELLTMDHSVAAALVACGALTADEARHSPYQHVLHKFLGCAGMQDGADVHPFTPRPGDRLLLASDGLTNYVSDQDLREGPTRFPQPQAWADHLVQLALDRGSKDNATCIVVVFEQA